MHIVIGILVILWIMWIIGGVEGFWSFVLNTIGFLFQIAILIGGLFLIFGFFVWLFK